MRATAFRAMRPTASRMAGGGDKIPGHYMGWWGNFGSQPQKGVTSYSLSANRQKPFAGAGHAAIFNTYRRCKGQFWYVVPPFVIVYFVVDWLEKRNKFLNSKKGRALYGAPG